MVDDARKRDVRPCKRSARVRGVAPLRAVITRDDQGRDDVSDQRLSTAGPSWRLRAPDDPRVCALVLPVGDGVAAPTAPPTNTAEPTISGRAEQGRTLSASRGSWSGTEPISFAYQWVRCGADGGRPDGGDCAIVSGATNRDYRLGSADVGFRMRVRVTATNSDGSRVAASNPTAAVIGPPVNTSTLACAARCSSAQVVTAEPGTWTGRSADLVLLPLAPLQLGRAANAYRSAARRVAELPRHRRRRRTQAALQRHRAKLDGLDDRHLDASPPS